MTAFVAEAQRLGIHIPPYIHHMAGYRPDVAGLYQPKAKPYTGPNQDAEGLCISGCTYCRDFRNSVREVLEAEAEARRQQVSEARRQRVSKAIVADLRDLATELESIRDDLRDLATELEFIGA